MSVLLAHEKKGGPNSAPIKSLLPQESSDSSDNEELKDAQNKDRGKQWKFLMKRSISKFCHIS